jgi:hypothetical protein
MERQDIFSKDFSFFSNEKLKVFEIFGVVRFISIFKIFTA